MEKEQLIASLNPIAAPHSMRHGLDDGYLILSSQRVYFICFRAGKWIVLYDLRRSSIVNVSVSTSFWKSSLIIKSSEGTVVFTKIPKGVDFVTMLTPVDKPSTPVFQKKGQQRATLTLDDAQKHEQVFEIIVQSCLIGRGRDCDIQIMDSSLSRRHCMIHKRDGQFLIEDLQSANGTSVNGAQILKKELLGNEEIQAGDLLFRFRLD